MAGDTPDVPPNEIETPAGATATIPETQRGIRFWGVFAALCVLAFISALDVSIIATALPRITAEIGSGAQFVWIANCFVISSTVLQPMFGQIADIFGRRYPLAISILIFGLGSAIGGGSHNVGMLIAGRTIQGVGAGGIYVLIDIVCCDLVPLRDRGKYLGLMFSGAGVAAALGPPVGGALAEADWRWIFWINLPICGLALALLLLFLRPRPRSIDMPWSKALKDKVDWVGALLLIPSLFAVLFGLITGGLQYPWSSWRVVVPLVLGILGWASFHVHQHFWASHPSIPSRLFANRTSATAFALTFLSSILIQATTYLIPIYFQGVLNTTVLNSGTYFLPYAMGSLFSAVLGGALLSKFGVYRPVHAAAFAISAIAFGLFTLLDSGTTTVAWAFFQLIAAAGTGIAMSTMLPAIMAGLPESDVAVSSAAYSFVRNFGLIWGITIPGIIFGSVVDMNLHRISDQGLQDSLRGGAAYAFASEANQLQDEYPQDVWDQVNDVYAIALRAVWWFAIGISILSFLAVAGEEGLELRTELDTEFGIDEEKKTQG
ncbi:major facilitator superfamily domain-containing protein [Stachybotrys elegans]|uniref:Major facilitator superfamily domain-containing protein n=1 Tax=Stachybotrys elegans TaxID=80388 RepID=A0A8K0SFV4_9HYPO|nr:major facilitator superfamily domain-containing protein [Stachybotrys elegans]